MKEEKKAASLGYATDALKSSAQAFTKVESVSVKRNNTRIVVNITKRREMSQSPQYHKYDISKYDLHPGYVFPENLESLIPSGTPEYVDSGQRYAERMIRALYYFKQCALIGPSGTGKTHITYLVAELTGLPVWEVNCGLQTSSYDLIGRFIGLGKENWVDGQVTCWLREGGLLYLDEANMMKQDVATRLNPALDTRGHLVVTEKDNEIVTRHPFAFLIISMNPFSAEFSGTKPLNAAFRRRMSVWVNFDYESVGEKISQKEVDLVKEKIKQRGLNYVWGGRFHHILGKNDKGRAVEILKELYENQLFSILTVGIGDSLNDVPMLLAVDEPILLKEEDDLLPEGLSSSQKLIVMEGKGPKVWNEVVLNVLKSGKI